MHEQPQRRLVPPISIPLKYDTRSPRGRDHVLCVRVADIFQIPPPALLCTTYALAGLIVVWCPQEELEWLGKRLSSEPSDPPDMLNIGGRGDVGIGLDDDEPSVIMPNAPRSSDLIRKRREGGG